MAARNGDDDDLIDPYSKPHPMGGVAQLFSSSISTIQRLKDSGELGPWFYIGNRPYINGADIKRFIDSRPTKRPRKQDAAGQHPEAPTDNDDLPMAAE